MPQKDYYKILEVDRDASKEDIRRAYRRLAKQYHPDRNKGNPEAEARFKDISEAYSVLSDDKKRRQYDLMGQAGAAGVGGDFWETIIGAAGRGGGRRTRTVTYEDLGDWGDLFSQFFQRDIGADETRWSATRSAPPENVIRRVRLPFGLAAKGGRIKVAVPIENPCPSCDGTGAARDGGTRACPTCGGNGMVQTAMGGFAVSRPCPQCFGRGRILEMPCSDCRGSGRRKRSRTFMVTIPPGVHDGQRIRLRGQGSQAQPGGPRGDVIVEVHIADDPRFRREGNDVFSEATVNLVQATLGTKITVETLQGKVAVRVPPGTSSGRKLRLKGKGIVGPDGRVGDHYVVIRVTTPTKLTEEQKRLLEQFADSAKLER